MKTSPRVLAVVCIIVSSVLAAGIPVSFVWEPVRPHDYDAFLAQVVSAVILVGSVFYSVRWYMKLSGRTHKVGSQAWAAILFWYSLLGILFGLFIILNALVPGYIFSARTGQAVVVIFGLVGFASGIWRERLRAAEKAVQQFDIDKALIVIALAVVGSFIVSEVSSEHRKKLISSEGAFTCLMPASPKVDSETIEVKGMKVQLKSFSTWNQANSEFNVAYADGPMPRSQEEAEKMLDLQRQTLTGGDDGRLIFAQNLALKGYSGRHYAAHTDNNRDADEMVYLVKRRLYLLVVVHDRGRDAEDVKHFFDSFTFEPQ